MAILPYGSTVAGEKIITEQELNKNTYISPLKTTSDSWNAFAIIPGNAFNTNNNATINVRFSVKGKPMLENQIDLILDYYAVKVDGIKTEKLTVQSFGYNPYIDYDIVSRWIDDGTNIGFYINIRNTNDAVIVKCEHFLISFSGVRESLKTDIYWGKYNALISGPISGIDIPKEIIRLNRTKMIYQANTQPLVGGDTVDASNTLTWALKQKSPSYIPDLIIPANSLYKLSVSLSFLGVGQEAYTKNVYISIRINGSTQHSCVHTINSTSTDRDVKDLTLFRNLVKGDTIQITVSLRQPSGLSIDTLSFLKIEEQ
jgi:hypothetical protein